MRQWLGIAVLFLMGAGLVIADVFLPSHFMLTLAALALFGYGVYLTFTISTTAGLVGIMLLAALVPATILLFIRVWPRTWLGRRIAPPNPVLTDKDRLPGNDLATLVGRTGRSITPLRPVGTCVFDGRRIECVAEHGVLAAHVEVEAVRVVDRTLCVRAASARSDATSGGIARTKP